MKEKLLLMCTCTWIEIWAAVGITAYLIHLQSYMLALVAALLFAPLIGFHFIMDRMSKKQEIEDGEVKKEDCIAGRC